MAVADRANASEEAAMAEPLEYFNPKEPEERSPADRRLAAAIPIEFDVLLTQSDEHAAVRAVETELRRHQILYFRAEGGARASRGVELHVRSADRDRAGQLAAMIFARRKRLDQAFPRPKPPRDTTSDGIVSTD
jgi:hypothetical protein